MSTNSGLIPLGQRLAPRASGAGRGLLSAVVEQLGLRVLSSAYPIGQTIPAEPALALELGVSRTVLREAIKILIAKGLFESRTKTGTRVRPRRAWNMLDPTLLSLYCQIEDYSEFAEHFQQLRFVIEPEAAALAAANRNEEQLEIIAAAYQAMATADDVAAWTEADLNFHEAILEATGNPFMIPLGSLIHTALESLLYNSAENSTDPFESLPFHEGVLDAIREGIPDGARTAMKALLGRTELAISRSIGVAQPPQGKGAKQPK